jgi:hypothetical protein
MACGPGFVALDADCRVWGAILLSLNKTSHLESQERNRIHYNAFILKKITVKFKHECGGMCYAQVMIKKQHKLDTVHPVVLKQQ